MTSQSTCLCLFLCPMPILALPFVLLSSAPKHSHSHAQKHSHRIARTHTQIHPNIHKHSRTSTPGIHTHRLTHPCFQPPQHSPVHVGALHRQLACTRSCQVAGSGARIYRHTQTGLTDTYTLYECNDRKQ